MGILNTIYNCRLGWLWESPGKPLAYHECSVKVRLMCGWLAEPMLVGLDPFPRRHLDLPTQPFQGSLHYKYLIIASLIFFSLNCLFLYVICNHFPQNDSSLNVQLSVIEFVYLCNDLHRNKSANPWNTLWSFDEYDFDPPEPGPVIGSSPPPPVLSFSASN